MILTRREMLTLLDALAYGHQYHRTRCAKCTTANMAAQRPTRTCDHAMRYSEIDSRLRAELEAPARRG